VGSVTVVHEDGTFYMIAYEKSDTENANKKFAIYISPATGTGSGTEWTSAGLVFDGDGAGLTDYDKIDGPYLFKDGDKYRLYFQVKTPAESPTRYDIYTAEADDTSLADIADGDPDADFTLANGNDPVLSPTSGAWDSGSVMQPWVVKDGDVYYMWYAAHTGSRPQLIGFAYSSDGYTWTKSRGNPIINEESTGYAEPSVIIDDGTWRMWTMGVGGGISYYNSTGPFEFSSIQSAIDKADSGDTINVAAGTYTEQVVIQQSVQLVGDGAGSTTIQLPATGTDTAAAGGKIWDYIIVAYPASGTIDVRIEGFTIDAAGLTKQADTAGLVGVLFNNVNGTQSGLNNCVIQGFEQVEYESWGVRVYGDSELAVEGNTLTGYTRDGITVSGDAGTGDDPVVTISGNTLTGSALPLQGISLLDGATGTITGNTVSDHTRSAEWAACGILVDNADGITVAGNEVTNCFYGIFIGEADNCIVSGNILTDNIKRAISLDTANNNTVSGNTITGPVAGTDDTAIGLDNNCAGNVIGGNTPSDGNTITMATSGTGNLYAIYMQASVGANNNTISYNTITGGQRAVQFDGPPGITGITTITNNTFTGQAWGGITAYNNGSLVITDNTLTNTTRPMEFWGPVNVAITGNTIDGALFDGINMGNVSGTKLISGNTISNINVNGMSAIHGRPDADNLVIDSNTISASYAAIWIDPGCTGVTITDNIIFNNTYSGISAYDALTAVTGNSIDNCWRGIEIDGALTAHNNSFTSNTYGSVIFHTNDVHDVTNNWWGTASGPGAYLNGVNINTFNQASQLEYIQANTYDNFIFAPWLNAAPPAGVSFAPVTNGTNGYASIQAAINAASPGGTINVAAGTYTELVTINTANITLLGPNAGVNPNTGARGAEAIIKPSAERTAGPWGAVLVTANGVTIDGFEVDGTTVCKNGINAYEANNVIIKNNIVHGAVNAWDGVGIMVWSWGAGTVDGALIENNDVYDTGRMGIIVLDHSGSSYELTSNHIIRGNTVHDTWKMGTEWDDGGGAIQINVGKDCTIADNEIYNTQDGNRGIYMFGSGTGNTITGNIIHDNPTGIQLWISGDGGYAIDWEGDLATSPAVHFNNIYDNTTYGAVSSNMAGYTVMVMDATNNWWGDASGPTHASNPGGSGDAVSDNVDYDPWIGAATEEVVSEELTGTGGAIPAEESPTGGAITVTGTGILAGTTLTAAQYTSNPGGPHGLRAQGYYDVYLSDITGVTSVTIEFATALPNTVIYYWDEGEEAWTRCSEQSYSEGAVTVTITSSTHPSLSDLVGSSGAPALYFMPATSPPIGGEAFPVSPWAANAPLIALCVVLAAGAGVFAWRRTRA